MTPERCRVCGRTLRGHHNHSDADARARGKSVVVHHRGYGCDTGCCGHEVLIVGANAEELWDEWTFSHPGGLSAKEFIDGFAGEVAAKYGLPIDYAASEVRDD